MARPAQTQNLPGDRASGAMPTVRRVEELREVVSAWRRAGLTIGLVPTMGSLHAGHLSLVAQAKAQCDRAIATIFVNPKQFDREGDLAGYPRTESRDAGLLADVGCDLLFAPAVTEVYPAGFATQVALQSALTQCLEGQHRPGHFDGVTTVVCKLLLQAGADRAYFGEKDYQQLLVVQKMVSDLNIPTDIVPCETVRDTDGLALSSRNGNLSSGDRQRAAKLITVLRQVAVDLVHRTEAVEEILREGRQALLQAGFDRIDYLEFRQADALEQKITDRESLAGISGRLLVAAWLGETRLIDNLAV